MSERGLMAPLFGDPEVDTAIGDAALARAMLTAEAALAQACEQAGVIPRGAGSAIASACAGLEVDIVELGGAARSSGNPVVPLVSLVRDAVDPSHRPSVHAGATSQDILDTALMLLCRDGVVLTVNRLRTAIASCVLLCRDHRDTVMLGRTLGQAAAPTTFGRKCAGWLVALGESTDRLEVVARDRLAVQLGGPVGILAAYGDKGAEVVAAFASRLGLPAPLLPWHTDRGRVHELAGAIGAVSAAAAKVAGDVVLMAQAELGEVTLATSGGSSSMPHKQNPVTAILVNAGAMRVPGLVATLLAVGSHEHERASGQWHAEWEPLRELVSLAGGIAANTADLLADLQPHPDRMRANLDAVAESIAPAADPQTVLGSAGAMVDRALATYGVTR
ncbi:MAG TPA: lyase family protein [Mycobacteriales bacterium]|nr:lyase family protein [Mycobacteriales bacterium]